MGPTYPQIEMSSNLCNDDSNGVGKRVRVRPQRYSEGYDANRGKIMNNSSDPVSSSSSSGKFDDELSPYEFLLRELYNRGYRLHDCPPSKYKGKSRDEDVKVSHFKNKFNAFHAHSHRYYLAI